MNELYVESIHRNAIQGDTSFTETGFWGSTPSYSQAEVRKIWFDGIKSGIRTGLHKASLPSQKIELTSSIKNNNQREFIEKFYELCENHNCAIVFHPEHGMVISDLNKNI